MLFAAYLAAATVLTFAPVNASAYTVSNDASSWTAGKSDDTTTPVILLTMGNPDGSVVLNYDYATSDTSGAATQVHGQKGSWSTVDISGYRLQRTDAKIGTATYPSTTGKADVETNANLWLTSSGSTLSVHANPSYLRTLTYPQVLTYTDPGTNKATKIVLAKNTAVMNHLKVELNNANDGSRERYLNHNSNDYYEAEAVPDAENHYTTSDADLKTNIKVDHNWYTNLYTNKSDVYGDDNSSPKSIPLNLKGQTDQLWTVTSNSDVTYRSSDDSIATVDAKGIHAKKVGTTTVTVTTKQNEKNYGNVVASFTVTVIDKPTAVLNGPSEIVVYGYNNPVKIGVTGTNIKANSITYKFVYWDATKQDYVDYNSQNKNGSGALLPFQLDSKNDTITALEYNGHDDKNVQWDAILQADAVGADGYYNPSHLRIHVRFQKDNQAGITDTSKDGVLDTITLAAGKSKKLNVKATAASGAAVSATFESENADIATVDANGVVKGVSAGSTRVKVTAGSVVKYYVVNVQPSAVAQVKVANVKGAKVKVSWKAAAGSNVKYYVYKTVWNSKGVKVSKAGKTVSSASTTLKVAKGYTVQVKVKAYVDTDETRLVGAYSSTVAKTTDKK